MSVTIFHNPRCSNSRATLAILTERGIRPQVVEYLKTPPNLQTLQELARKLGLTPRDMIRSGEPEYADNGLSDPSLSDTQILQAVTEHPKLLQRPIVVVDEQAVIGRPPEIVLDLL